MDSEMRFYATLFAFYGVAVLGCIKGIELKGQYVRLLALILFVGGLARTISMFKVGRPHSFFVAMTALEFVLPLLIVFLQSRIEKMSTL